MSMSKILIYQPVHRPKSLLDDGRYIVKRTNQQTIGELVIPENKNLDHVQFRVTTGVNLSFYEIENLVDTIGSFTK